MAVTDGAFADDGDLEEIENLEDVEMGQEFGPDKADVYDFLAFFFWVSHFSLSCFNEALFESSACFWFASCLRPPQNS